MSDEGTKNNTYNLTPIDIIHQIMIDKEPKPDLDCNLWKVSSDNLAYVILSENIQEISYYINDDIVNSMKEYTKFIQSFDRTEQNKLARKNIKKDLFARIFLIENLKTGYKYIDHTYNSLIYTIKMGLHKRNIGEKNIFDHFIDGKLTDLKCSILEFIKTNQRSIIQQHKKIYNDLLIIKPKKNNILEAKIKNINDKYEKLRKIYHKILRKHDIEISIREFFIYQIVNLNNKKKYIFGTINKIDSQDTFNKILQQIIGRNNALKDDINYYGFNNFTLDKIETYKGTSTLDFYLKIDYYIYLYDSIKTGYNTKYNLPESTFYQKKNPNPKMFDSIEGSFFVRIQRENFDKKFKDDRDYSKIIGFIVMISYNDNKYITFAKKTTLKDLILIMYHKILNGPSKDDDICEMLYDVPYNKLNFRMLKLKYNGDGINLQKETEKYKDKYDL